jgi:hypothetical protein
VNITSYNITDVGYHYIGLKALAGLPGDAGREAQIGAISRSVNKYVIDKALRLMLPQPRGTFESIGEKIAQELTHFDFARTIYGKGYELTEQGRNALQLLNSREYINLRQLMVQKHLATYDNFRDIFRRHLEVGPIFSPIVETGYLSDRAYITRLLEPSLGESALNEMASIWNDIQAMASKKVEDILREKIFAHLFPGLKISVAVFRAIFDRLASLRLLNYAKASLNGADYLKTYSPCLLRSPKFEWHVPISVDFSKEQEFTFFMSEPVMSNPDVQALLLSALDKVFDSFESQAGYYDLPEVRDLVCERLMIPEASFDEGINFILNQTPSPLTVGLRYEGISARRKPLIRSGESTSIYNLIRRG